MCNENLYEYIYTRETAAFSGVSLALREAKPDLQVEVSEMLGADSQQDIFRKVINMRI